MAWQAKGNIKGPAGAAGPQGPTGATGPAGVRGSVWLVQPNAPGVVPGALPGDCFLNSLTGDIYQADSPTRSQAAKGEKVHWRQVMGEGAAAEED